MTAHDHPDDRLTVGCPACIAEAREYEWEHAPWAVVTIEGCWDEDNDHGCTTPCTTGKVPVMLRVPEHATIGTVQARLNRAEPPEVVRKLTAHGWPFAEDSTIHVWEVSPS